MSNKRLALKTKQSSGLSLLEVIISIAVVSIAISALVVISNAAIRSVNESRNNAIADQYVRQALEATRVNRDQKGWVEFIAMPSSTMSVGSYRVYSLDGTNMDYRQALTGGAITANPCSSYIKTSNYLITGSANFYRSVVLHRTATNEMEITANVCYGYRGSSEFRLSTAQTILSDWQ
jgi:type II secretory pathway pseudopilin PulG